MNCLVTLSVSRHFSRHAFVAKRSYIQPSQVIFQGIRSAKYCSIWEIGFGERFRCLTRPKSGNIRPRHTFLDVSNFYNAITTPFAIKTWERAKQAGYSFFAYVDVDYIDFQSSKLDVMDQYCTLAVEMT